MPICPCSSIRGATSATCQLASLDPSAQLIGKGRANRVEHADPGSRKPQVPSRCGNDGQSSWLFPENGEDTDRQLNEERDHQYPATYPRPEFSVEFGRVAWHSDVAREAKISLDLGKEIVL